MSQEEIDKSLELILYSSTLDEIKNIIRRYNDKVVAEGRKEDKIKGLSLPKDGLIRSIQQFISDEDRKKLFNELLPVFVQSLLENADALANGRDKREKIASWNTVDKGYSIYISGFQWEESTTVQKIETGMYRKCTCRIGKYDGFCMHEMSIFLKLFNEKMISLTDFPLPMDPSWLKTDSHGQVVPSSQKGLSIDSFNQWRIAEKLAPIQINGTIEDVVYVKKIGSWRESEYGRYTYVTGEIKPYSFQIRFTEDRMMRCRFSQKDYIKFKGKINQIKGDTIFIGRLSDVQRSDASKYKEPPKMDQSKKSEVAGKSKEVIKPEQEIPNISKEEEIKEGAESIDSKKPKKSSKKLSKRSSKNSDETSIKETEETEIQQSAEEKVTPVIPLEQRTDADIEFDDMYQIFIEGVKIRTKWGGKYPGDKIIDTSEGKDDAKTWLAKKIVERLSKIPPELKEVKEGDVRKINKDNYGIIKFIIETEVYSNKLLKAYKEKKGMPQSIDELKDFLTKK